MRISDNGLNGEFSKRCGIERNKVKIMKKFTLVCSTTPNTMLTMTPVRTIFMYDDFGMPVEYSEFGLEYNSHRVWKRSVADEKCDTKTIPALDSLDEIMFHHNTLDCAKNPIEVRLCGVFLKKYLEENYPNFLKAISTTLYTLKRTEIDRI